MWWNVPAVMARGYGCPRDKGRRAATIMFNHPWHIIALIVPLNLNTHTHVLTHTHTHTHTAAVQGSSAGAPSVSLVSSGPCLQWLWELLLPQVVHGPAYPSRGARPGHMVCGAQGRPRGGPPPATGQDRQQPQPTPVTVCWNVPVIAEMTVKDLTDIIQSFWAKLSRTGGRSTKWEVMQVKASLLLLLYSKHMTELWKCKLIFRVFRKSKLTWKMAALLMYPLWKWRLLSLQQQQFNIML